MTDNKKSSLLERKKAKEKSTIAPKSISRDEHLSPLSKDINVIVDKLIHLAIDLNVIEKNDSISIQELLPRYLDSTGVYALYNSRNASVIRKEIDKYKIRDVVKNLLSQILSEGIYEIDPGFLYNAGPRIENVVTRMFYRLDKDKIIDCNKKEQLILYLTLEARERVLKLKEKTQETRPTASKLLKENTEEQETSKLDLTARGTPRVRKPMRSRQELGGNPNEEQHRYDVKLGGRVPRELRDKFVKAIENHDLNQGKVLTELIEKYLENLEAK